MKELKNLGIELLKKSYRSDFLQEMLEDELAELINSKELLSGSLNFMIDYFYKGSREIEFGLFIINKSIEEIFIEEVPFVIKNKASNKVLKEFTYEIKEKIKINKASFHEIKMDINGFDLSSEQLTLAIGDSTKMTVDNYFTVNVQNLDSIKKYSAIRALKKFTKSLELMRKDELRADLYAIYSDENNVVVILYFRNSSNRDISIKSIPINIYSEGNLLAYRDILLLEDNSLLVPKESGMFFKVSIDKEKFPLEGKDIEKCRVDFIR